jgi:transposase
MSQKSATQRAAAEKVVKDIRRATRKQHSAEEKIGLVLGGLRGEESITEHCSSGSPKACTTAGRRSSWKPASGA